MKINNYKNFNIQLKVEEFINESRLVVTDNLKIVLNSILDDAEFDENGLKIKTLARLLINITNCDFDTDINYIDTTSKPGMVSFIPDDKIEYDDVSINYKYIMNSHHKKLFKILGIPLDGLNFYGSFNDNNIKNSFKVLKRFDIFKDGSLYDDSTILTLNQYIENIIYYLQNNYDKNVFVVVCVDYRMPSDAITANKVPENRRTESRIGRVVNKLLDAYLSKTQRAMYTPQLIESFVNMFIASATQINENFENFSIVEGPDIKKWYNENTYKNDKGHLGSSCMRFPECNSYFDIYVKNPDVCKMLILTDKEDKLMGRALLWTLMDGKKIMDRIYTNKDSLKNLFEKWGNKNGYISKSKLDRSQISVKVKPIKYSEYPYMDTFLYYLPEKGILTNSYEFSDFRNFKRNSGSVLNTLKNPKSLLKMSTYRKTPLNKELVFTLNSTEGDYVLNYVKVI